MTEADLLRENAELTASNARLREQMADVLVQSTNWMNKFDARQEAIRLAELNNTQLCQAAKGILNSTPYHLTSCRYVDTFGVKPCDCPLGSARGHMEKLIVQSPAESLAAIQDAARTEERETCAGIVDEAEIIMGRPYEGENARETLRQAAKEIRNRGNAK